MKNIRSIGIFNAQPYTATVIGCGGIGSFTAVLLAKMGLRKLVLYDPDVVEEENVGTQVYGIHDVGSQKVSALVNHILNTNDFKSVVLEVFPTHYNGAIPTDIYVSAVDSIEARITVTERILNVFKEGQLFIDASMAAEYLMISVYTHDLQKHLDYLKGLDPTKIPDEPCTAKATVYTGMLIASLIGNIVRKYITGEPLPRVVAMDVRKWKLSAI